MQMNKMVLKTIVLAMCCEWTDSLTNGIKNMNYECQYSPVNLPALEENVEIPMMIMMRGFQQLKCTNTKWHSPVFYTHKKGYYFKLRVTVWYW